MNQTEQTVTPQWYPWCREAFEKAAEEHRPILLSVGSRCADAGSCRDDAMVMRIAQRYYVPIHIDAEELPGAAAVYGQASAMLAGQMEPPFAVIADHMGNPFFAMDDTSPVALSGVLSRVAMNWNSDSHSYERTAATVHQRMERLGQSVSNCTPSPRLWENHYKVLQSHFDETYGGFGDGAKYPMAQELLFLLAYHRCTGEEKALNMAAFTLQQIAFGAIRDHIGGGFFHCTTDNRWEKPKTQKYLTDQAWLLQAYVEAYARTGYEPFRVVAKELADFVIRELRCDEGGFYTAQWDAPEYYQLTDRRVRARLGENDGSVFCKQYCIGETPTMPHLFNGEQPEEDSLLLQDGRTQLYRSRLERGIVQRDERIFTGKNGVMIAALARAGRILGVERYLTAASDGEAFLAEHLRCGNDLQHYWRNGKVSGEAVLEDYAGYALGLYELYRCGCGQEYLRNAAKVMARADALFSDWNQDGYFLTRGNRNLPIRPKQFWEENEPSPQSIALKVLIDLAKDIPHPGLQKRAKEQMAYAAGASRSYACGYALAAMMG